jgi:hypothetical protein
VKKVKVYQELEYDVISMIRLFSMTCPRL